MKLYDYFFGPVAFPLQNPKSRSPATVDFRAETNAIWRAESLPPRWKP